MYELIQVGPQSYYVQSPAKIGIVKCSETEVCLIDSGSDKDAGKKVKKHLDANGWTLRAVFNTHSHADHIGGNAYLQAQTGCKIYARGMERDFTRHPLLEPMFLYGGCPPKDLRHKFLLAQESDAEELTADVLPDGWELLPLDGHSFDMVGFRTPDDAVFLADCLSAEQTLAKYGIPFLYDAEAYLETLERVKTWTATQFVPSHAETTADIAPLAQANIDHVRALASHIVELCREPRGFEELLRQLFADYGLTMTFEQYALVGSTVRSFLSVLKREGRLAAAVEDNRLLWSAV